MDLHSGKPFYDTVWISLDVSVCVSYDSVMVVGLFSASTCKLSVAYCSMCGL